jgi:hypothetical protein
MPGFSFLFLSAHQLIEVRWAKIDEVGHVSRMVIFFLYRTSLTKVASRLGQQNLPQNLTTETTTMLLPFRC